MKLSEVVKEIKKGEYFSQLHIIFPYGRNNGVEDLSCAMTIMFKKHVDRQEGDEVIPYLGKEFNISELERLVKFHSKFEGSEINARLGNRYITIELD